MPTVVIFAGEYDLSLKSEFQAELASLEAIPHVVLDFIDVTYMDGCCVNELLRLEELRQARRLEPLTIVVQRGTAVHRIFDILNMGSVFRLAESIAEAIPRNGESLIVRYAFSGIPQLDGKQLRLEA